MKAKKQLWTLWSLDVWGNRKDGYEVNDRYQQTENLELPENPTDKQIIDTLKKQGYLKKRTHLASFTIDGDDQVIYIDSAKDAYPLYQLELND